MLIEFRLKNFRSIKEEQVLSLVASTAHKEQETQASHTMQQGKFTLLRSAAIYGPNAAGKSNILKGLAVMKKLIIKDREPDESIDVIPYLFDETSQKEPTEFEVTFMIKGVRYQYGFTATSERFLEEWLFAWPNKRSQTLIERRFNPKSKQEKWGNMASLSGAKQLWQNSTRPNALFLKTAVNLNSQDLKPVYTWFSQYLKIILAPLNLDLPNLFTIEEYAKPSKQQKIIDFVNTADPSIHNLNITFEEVSDPRVLSILKNFSERKKDFKIPKIESFHKTNDKIYSINMDDESYGTSRMFSLAGPWLDVIENGYILLLDEIFNNLHPTLVEFLLQQFHNPKINKKNAQLIFATHDTTILHSDTLRRDQVWFAEKDRQNATKLTPLSDFSPRNVENLEKNYLTGRYGALPFLR